MALSEPPEASQLPSGPKAEQSTPLECPVCNTSSGRVVVLSLREAEFPRPASVAKLRNPTLRKNNRPKATATILLGCDVANPELILVSMPNPQNRCRAILIFLANGVQSTDFSRAFLLPTQNPTEVGTLNTCSRSSNILVATSHGPNRCRYSSEVMKAFTISAF